MGNHKRQVLKALQLIGLLVADLQTNSVVAFLQLQRVLGNQTQREREVCKFSLHDLVILSMITLVTHFISSCSKHAANLKSDQ